MSDDLSLDDASFLEAIADGFAAVTIKPKGNTAGQISAAHDGTRQFRDRGVRLRAIARRFRQWEADQKARQRATMDNDA